jgi:predicted AlkP superfamily pyrophosphatase or phosphodiesterase
MADYAIPDFPTQTFPNHFTIVTGQRPDGHGIVANEFIDPHFQDKFIYNTSAAQEKKWWGANPVVFF